MIKKISHYQVICDNCGSVLENSTQKEKKLVHHFFVTFTMRRAEFVTYKFNGIRNRMHFCNIDCRNKKAKKLGAFILS